MRKIKHDGTILIKGVMEDFNLLTQDGIVGFYNRCEIIEIFGLKNRLPFNIFTLVTFEKSDEINEKEEFLTPKLNKFAGVDDVKWGIARKIISVEQCKNFFNDLANNNIFRITNKISEIGELSFIKKQYIPPEDSLEKVQLNKILKNNFNNGSYIIEAFDLKKKNVDFLTNNPVLLNHFSESVSDIIPISIGTLSDRLGNVIFQFPIRIFETKMSVIKPNRGFTLKLIYDKAVKIIPRLQLIAFNKFEGSTMDFKTQEIQEEAEIFVSTSNNVDAKILEPKNNLILSSSVFSTIKNINIHMNIASKQNRVFKINNKLHEISISSSDNFSALNYSKSVEEWIFDRKYEQELKALEKAKSFIQYYGNKGEKALNDVRNLIAMYGENGVFLWDPYLNAIDIKNTLYYTPYSHVQLKAITNLKDTNSCNKKDIIQGMQKEFKSDDLNYLFLNLEVRSKIGNHGWDFHDRFLIFPLEKPKVWSLGISVNQLGKAHHILQEVKNAQHILNAFNKLWNELDNKECLVWKTI